MLRTDPEILFAGRTRLVIRATGAYKAALAEMIDRVPAVDHPVADAIYESATGVGRHIEAGATFDIVITTTGVMAGLVDKSFVAAESIVAVGSNAISLGFRAGRPRPDLSTPEALTQTLLSAASISLSDPRLGGASSLYFMKVIAALGLTAAIAPRLVLTEGGGGARPVGDGRAEVAIAQTSEIACVPGLDSVPLVPHDPACRSVYAAGLSVSAKPAAAAFMALLSTPEADAIRLRHGLA